MLKEKYKATLMKNKTEFEFQWDASSSNCLIYIESFDDIHSLIVRANTESANFQYELN